MKLKNLLFVFCLALLAGCQKDPDTESAPARDTDRVEGVIRMKLDRETAEAPSEHARQGSTCGMSFVSKDLPSRSPKTSERLPA